MVGIWSILLGHIGGFLDDGDIDIFGLLVGGLLSVSSSSLGSCDVLVTALRVTARAHTAGNENDEEENSEKGANYNPHNGTNVQVVIVVRCFL